MKRLFINLWKRNLALFKLAIVTNLEYRMNFIADSFIQPACTAVIETIFWVAIFKTAESQTIRGFSVDSYIAYVMWATFFARISVNWMYEWKMISEIENGSINAVLSRPISYFEYFLSQFLGYKFIITFTSLIIPIIVVLTFNLPTQFTRIPLALFTAFYYLFFVYLLSFIVSTFAFHFNKVFSFSMAKNISITVLTGELFPIDLIPEPFGSWVMRLPFIGGVFTPVGYITGRVDINTLVSTWISISIGCVILSIVAVYFWKYSLKKYSGVGA